MRADPSVLIVDDDDDICEALAETLEDHGFTVITASNGLEGLEVLRRQQTACVILLDLMMPLLDGYGFLAAQQADAAIALVPVAIITAAGRGVDQQRIGGLPIISKPFKLSELLATIRKLQALIAVGA